VNLITFNYRSFGESTGIATQDALFQDALFLYDTLIAQYKIPKESLYIAGRSLGTGVATYLVSKRKTPGVILITPYDSILALAEKQYPIFPIKTLLRHHFLSLEYAQVQENQLLSLIAGKDRIIPRSHTDVLMSVWRGKKRIQVLEEATHEDIMTFPQVQSEIENFLHAKK
jgi:hypothetical protein